MRLRAMVKSVFLALFVIIALPGPGYTETPEVSHMMVTDVTTRSFSVIWASSEPSIPGVEVYEDEAGTLPLPGLVITPHPVESGDIFIKAAAEDNGVMKVRVTGLASNTTYYFRTWTTAKSTSETTYYPETSPFLPVTTEALTVRTYSSGGSVLPFSNDIIIQECYLADEVTPADGTLLVATVAGANYPLTAFVGDGIEAPYALIDLNNVFSLELYENLNLRGEENLTLLNFRGMAGYSIVTHEVPADNSLSELKPGASALKPGWNMFSCQLEPGLTDIEEVLAPLGDKVDAVWAYKSSTGQWLSIDRSVPSFLWDLEELHGFTGYWVVMNSEDSLMVNGNFSSQSISLYPGWNLVGSRWIETIDLMDALSSIFDKVEAVWTYDTGKTKWFSYDKNIPPFLNDLFTMQPGKAYWLVMSGSCNDETCSW